MHNMHAHTLTLPEETHVPFKVSSSEYVYFGYASCSTSDSVARCAACTYIVYVCNLLLYVMCVRCAWNSHPVCMKASLHHRCIPAQLSHCCQRERAVMRSCLSEYMVSTPALAAVVWFTDNVFDPAGLHQVQKLRYTAKDWSYI